MVVMAFLGFLNQYTMRTNLSVAIVAMTENRTVVMENGTVSYVGDCCCLTVVECIGIDGLQFQEQYFDWSSSVQGYVLSSFFYGYLITQIPGGYVSQWFGPHIVRTLT